MEALNTVTIPAKRAAEAVLQALVVGGDGIFTPPIDPFELAKTLGIEVYVTPLASGLSGFIAKPSPEEPAKIYVNSTHSHVRQRFTVAHEIGHFFHEGLLRNGSYDSLRREEGHANLGTDPKERWANSFAASLLMPGGPVSTLYASGRTTSELASTFNVSEAAMSFRLANLGLQ